jgi:hypothetical protein
MGSAKAGEEIKCAAQYGFDERLILEWAALGGDPHAQYAITQCAYPDNHGPLSQDEKIYALKWMIVAACDASDSSEVLARDQATRNLRRKGDLSFRRFGGVSEDEETWTKREKRFREYRDIKEAKLQERYAALQAEATEADRAEARDALADQFSRMGALGLLRLSELASCESFGASKSFAAASLAAADAAWSAPESASVFGTTANAELTRESTKAMAALSPKEKRAAEAQKAELLKTEPSSLSRLENLAALGRLEELATVYADVDESSFARRSVTSAVQYALEAMGFLSFVNGPDNDYGPSTIEAAKKAQAYYGHEESRWLSHEEVRQVVCDAATRKGDPISYFHLGVMYSEGWGFPKDLERARYAINRASDLMKSRLANADELPSWKQSHYPQYKVQIDNAETAIESARASAPAGLRLKAGRIDDSNLCQ